MQSLEPDEEEFWSDVYRGRTIAIFHRTGRWHVYLDHVFQHNLIFVSSGHAIQWLTKRVDNLCATTDCWQDRLAA
jgi:hypothetical protein